MATAAPTALAPVRSLLADDDRRHHGREVYRKLTGTDPADADIEDDDSFDRHVMASILAVSATEGGTVGERAGLSTIDLVGLIAEMFPSSCASMLLINGVAILAEDDEITMVRDLLSAQRSTEGDVGRWLAAMVARRALEPNHLWEDLGLRERSELSRLLMRHFAPLARRNTGNMRWKRFFYRTLCEDDGFVMCTTPVCTQCNDFDLCFGEESGESRMALRRREVAQREAAETAAQQATAC
jgi:nitrogen fixation protein NifQ